MTNEVAAHRLMPKDIGASVSDILMLDLRSIVVLLDAAERGLNVYSYPNDVWNAFLLASGAR